MAGRGSVGLVDIRCMLMDLRSIHSVLVDVTLTVSQDYGALNHGFSGKLPENLTDSFSDTLRELKYIASQLDCGWRPIQNWWQAYSRKSHGAKRKREDSSTLADDDSRDDVILVQEKQNKRDVPLIYLDDTPDQGIPDVAAVTTPSKVSSELCPSEIIPENISLDVHSASSISLDAFETINQKRKSDTPRSGKSLNNRRSGRLASSARSSASRSGQLQSEDLDRTGTSGGMIPSEVIVSEEINKVTPEIPPCFDLNSPTAGASTNPPTQLKAYPSRVKAFQSESFPSTLNGENITGQSSSNIPSSSSVEVTVNQSPCPVSLNKELHQVDDDSTTIKDIKIEVMDDQEKCGDCGNICYNWCNWNPQVIKKDNDDADVQIDDSSNNDDTISIQIPMPVDPLPTDKTTKVRRRRGKRIGSKSTSSQGRFRSRVRRQRVKAVQKPTEERLMVTYTCDGCGVELPSREAIVQHKCHTSKNQEQSESVEQTKSQEQMMESKIVAKLDRLYGVVGSEVKEKQGMQESQNVEQKGQQGEMAVVGGAAPAGSPRKKQSSEDGKNNERYVCQICKKVYMREGCFRNHLLSHNSKRVFKCATCHEKFPSRYQLNTHLKQNFKCVMEQPAVGRVRVMKKSTSPSWSCHVCHRSFSEKCHLCNHMRTHNENPKTQDVKFFCRSCSKTFTRKCNLIKHLKTHKPRRRKAKAPPGEQSSSNSQLPGNKDHEVLERQLEKARNSLAEKYSNSKEVVSVLSQQEVEATYSHRLPVTQTTEKGAVEASQSSPGMTPVCTPKISESPGNNQFIKESLRKALQLASKNTSTNEQR